VRNEISTDNRGKTTVVWFTVGKKHLSCLGLKNHRSTPAGLAQSLRSDRSDALGMFCRAHGWHSQRCWDEIGIRNSANPSETNGALMVQAPCSLVRLPNVLWRKVQCFVEFRKVQKTPERRYVIGKTVFEKECQDIGWVNGIVNASDERRKIKSIVVLSNDSSHLALEVILPRPSHRSC
jgi:hypothetical protein